MTDADWHTGYARSLGGVLNGRITEPGPWGEDVREPEASAAVQRAREPVS